MKIGDRVFVRGYIDEIRKDTVTGTATAKSYNVPAMQGWICPVCGKGVSPYTAVCPCKNGKGWQGTS